jgi:hypothetical protein
MRPEHARGADALLLQYVDETSRIASPRGQRITSHAGLRTSPYCQATRHCSGTPRSQRDGWKCSRCNKPWLLEQVELPKGAIGGRVAIWGKSRRVRRSSSSSRYQPQGTLILDDPQRAKFGLYLDEVETEMPAAFAAWWIHVLDPTLVLEGNAERSRAHERRAALPMNVESELGLPFELIPDRMLELARVGALRKPRGEITVRRVIEWVREARGGVMSRVVERGL